jgi:MOSC domain-containing protein YiiM
MGMGGKLDAILSVDEQTVPVFEGRLVGIYTSAGAGEPMDGHDELRAIEGVGLDGDRYALTIRSGKFSDREGTGRQVTLVEREAVAAANREAHLDLAERDTRRNLVTEDVPLNHLVDRTFRIGDVVLQGKRLAEPCSYLASLTAPGASRALVHRGGLRADVLTGGTLRVGDAISEVRPD